MGEKLRMLRIFALPSSLAGGVLYLSSPAP
jgi:hypothetical protein